MLVDKTHDLIIPTYKYIIGPFDSREIAQALITVIRRTIISLRLGHVITHLNISDVQYPYESVNFLTESPVFTIAKLNKLKIKSNLELMSYKRTVTIKGPRDLCITDLSDSIVNFYGLNNVICYISKPQTVTFTLYIHRHDAPLEVDTEIMRDLLLVEQQKNAYAVDYVRAEYIIHNGRHCLELTIYNCVHPNETIHNAISQITNLVADIKLVHNE